MDIFFAPRRFLLSLDFDKVLLFTSFLFLISLFLCPVNGYVVIVALICVPHDLGCVVETYWLPIGRCSSDASRRPSRSPPSCEPRTILFLLTIFTICSSIPPPAYTLHLLTFIITIVHHLFCYPPFHSPLCSELVPLAP